MMKKIFASLLLIAGLQLSKAQDLETILLAAEDASLLTENYLNPAMEGLMFSMNGGWATTAKVHKKFGFDLTIGFNASFVPDESQVFAFIPSDYSFLTKSTMTSKETVKWEDGNEYPLIKIEVSSASHPFFTGKKLFVDTAGRVEKFNRKYKKK